MQRLNSRLPAPPAWTAIPSIQGFRDTPRITIRFLGCVEIPPLFRHTFSIPSNSAREESGTEADSSGVDASTSGPSMQGFLMHRRIGARVALYKDHNTIMVYIYFLRLTNLHWLQGCSHTLFSTNAEGGRVTAVFDVGSGRYNFRAETPAVTFTQSQLK